MFSISQAGFEKMQNIDENIIKAGPRETLTNEKPGLIAITFKQITVKASRSAEIVIFLTALFI